MTIKSMKLAREKEKLKDDIRDLLMDTELLRRRIANLWHASITRLGASRKD